MLEEHVYSDWDEPCSGLEFEMKYCKLLKEVYSAASYCMSCIETGRDDCSLFDSALKLYIMAQAIPSVILNYKICIDFGLPLHPTEYIDFNIEEKDVDKCSLSEKRHADLMLRRSINIAKSLCILDPYSLGQLERFRDGLPDFLKSFVYTSKKDKYTWAASNPEHIKMLAGSVERGIGKIDLIVGAAHGSIRPGLILSNLLGCDVYFLRYSLFRREDPSPIISASDKEFLSIYHQKKVLIFDEDVAKGITLKNFVGALQPMFKHSSSASVLCHYLSPFKPDFVGKMFY